ncbi:MAG: endopeptidase La [Spirochaetales bacterium]|nr:endopeptidase La [Spirochaetales bacterium]
MIKAGGKSRNLKPELPLVPLRDLVVFPHMVIPFFVGRSPSVKAVEEAMKDERLVFLACQKNTVETPEEHDIYGAGTVAKILQMLKLPDGTIRVLAEGKERGLITRFSNKKDVFFVQINVIPEDKKLTPAITGLMSALQNSFRKYAKFKKKITPDTKAAIEKAEYPDKLIDLVCSNSGIKTESKIEILRLEETEKRLERLAIMLESENEILSLQNRINAEVKKKLEKNQREYYLNEQLRQINRELGKDEEDPSGARELEIRLNEKNLPEEVKLKTEKEIRRLSKLQPMSPESGVLRTYLEWIADLPWNETSRDNKDIDKAARILDEDHYNMKVPKERILDFIAVRQLKEKIKGPILCFVGPPGTGKTSLGKSVARALGREFVRISLGGVRDEAEIRGHRKTYIGALPGKIVQSMRKVGTINPVFLLDEIDKISSDFRGDPAAALLEVLDPEQNSTFLDHYLEVAYDLSHIMFLTTANSIHSIPHPLRDRMEIIEIPGYSHIEKTAIANQFIIPKQLDENGLTWANIKFQQASILKIIREYTMESGVRNLEREIGSVIRKIARKAVKEGLAENTGEKRDFNVMVTPKSIEGYLGVPKFTENMVSQEQRPGLAYGLAWTELGGTLLPVEVAVFKGTGEVILTGNLGDVMKESARIAHSFIKTAADIYKLREESLKEKDIHVHVPEGAIPKDGPSAGITLTAAILSALTGKNIRKGVAMTGEITLTGRILAIGGVKEKMLAAYRNKMDTVLLPEDNRKDMNDIPKEVKNSLRFVHCSNISDAIRFLFDEEQKAAEPVRKK